MTLPGICRFRASNRPKSNGESSCESFRADSVNLPDHHFPAIINTWTHRAASMVKKEAPVRARWRPMPRGQRQ